MCYARILKSEIMRNTMTSLCICFLVTFFLASIYSCGNAGKDVSMESLVMRDSVMYEVNTDIPFTGRGIERYNNEQFSHIIGYSEGLKHGKEQKYTENGTLLEEFTHSKGELHGTYSKFFMDGKLYHSIDYKNGKKEGKVVDYFDDGNIQTESYYKDGKLNGKVESFMRNGKLGILENYMAGEKHGKQARWNEDGIKLAESYYANGDLDGASMAWYSNGNKKTESHYKNGKGHGEFRRWNEDGTLVSELKRMNGKNEGNYSTFYSDGSKKEKGKYVSGEKSWDDISFWNEDGTERPDLKKHLIGRWESEKQCYGKPCEFLIFNADRVYEKRSSNGAWEVSDYTSIKKHKYRPYSLKLGRPEFSGNPDNYGITYFSKDKLVLKVPRKDATEAWHRTK